MTVWGRGDEHELGRDLSTGDACVLIVLIDLMSLSLMVMVVKVGFGWSLVACIM